MFDVLMTLELRQIILIVHIVALVMGFGVAMSVELLLLRSLFRNRTSAELVNFAEQSAQIMTFGFMLLWVTGIGFLFYYHFNSPELLLTEKTSAKMVIVAVLTMNCAMNHRFVLPTLRKYSGRQVLASATQNETLMLAVYASVSLVSWIFPLLFSFNPALNTGYSVFNLLGQYVLVLTFTSVLACAVAMKVRDRSRSVSLLSYHGTAVAQAR